MKYILSLLAVLFSFQLHAQDINKEELKVISRTMYQDGNPRYVFLDALIDGHIKLKDGKLSSYAIVATSDDFELLNVKLSEKAKAEYSEKLNVFLTSMGERTESTHSIAINGASLADILDPTSDFRNISKLDLLFYNIDRRSTMKILSEMISDGTISASGSVHLAYNKNGLFVNNQKLQGETLKKYQDLYTQEFGIDPLSNSGMAYKFETQDIKEYMN